MHLQPVILSGGSGTRLWPLSREKHPKQLLALTEKESMLQATATRMHGFVGTLPCSENPIVVCNEEYRFITAEQLRNTGRPASRLILEPVGRNTAPALTLAALAAKTDEDDPVLLVTPADHIIRDRAAFHRAIDAGLAHAIDGAMVTFGIVPDRPETGYGYILAGAAFPDKQVRQLAAFIEKPDLETAKNYLASGNYLWNSGIFMTRAGVWLKAIRYFNQTIATACENAYQAAQQDADFTRIDKTAFTACPSDSIDYAVMEKLGNAPQLGIPACVVPLDAGWSDVGAWDAVWQVADKDEFGNSTQGDVILENSRNTLVIADSRLVACLGLDNVIVVETPDAVLVADKDQTQQLRNIVTRLKAEDRPQISIHRKVYRPWGTYDAIDCGDRFQVKRIVVNPGSKLSLQMHHHRAEHWIVVKGTARITKGDEILIITENQSIYIPLGVTHRLENPGKIPLELIEVQSGAYLSEEDIVRFEDGYGRSENATTRQP